MSRPKEAIVLAGGMGTRLASVVSDVPKPMAPVAGRPFLEYLFPILQKVGIERVVLSVGHKWEVIEAHFGHNWQGIEIAYAVETVPLGTGGGIKLAFAHTKAQQVLVLNGDTLFVNDLNELWSLHQRSDQPLLSIALKEMQDFDRYGTVEVGSDGRILAFREKQPMKSGLINAGIYVIDRDLWQNVEVGEKFSFEKDIMERYVGELPFKGFAQDGYFIDIGIPEDYARANRELPTIEAQILGRG